MTSTPLGRLGSGLGGDAVPEQRPGALDPDHELLPRPATRRALVDSRPIGAWILAGPALVIALWAVGSATGVIPDTVLSAPWTVLRTAWTLALDGSLWSNILASAQRAIVGGVLGVALAVVLALFSGLTRPGEALIDGTVTIYRAIPALALLPLFIVWFGIGEEMKIVLITLAVATPVYLNTHAGLRGIDRKYVELAETVGLRRAAFVRHIAIPGALPGFFTGLRLGATVAWLALVVVEQVGASDGIGYLMYKARLYGLTDVIVVGLAVYAVLGFGTDLAVRTLSRKALSWQSTLAH
ncbi:Binding-protein-dependent transport systems inner membrane component OS=Tsukamurella paurometabola(strain ATCC 8368 / DSM / CCUG 35730 / CIP 100753 / JCM 10117 / KCTC 9821 / NBRC 16120 / NCIMB 702349 / NCTC 13040)OX=521096 GN=Tpau_2979 PE=3 SV=1 [Tsukamurella paurometabola]|uniref:Binding-protein-dependent transport systems inner membrane component n=1 Tax=Tsukamurella paurometabola (strain ATCC 8368 / DSM 20162 / CCUG 35730 / CIP 100753 / JCM 10117 / KCTC 9821 / NBRC 16120 / NCIMB 702349 / NCTC 13040) TaxID=521096 RepID=D5UU72_TSUPD|nr:ABC transporter permease [Tsukamurella paurometabola]ADG79575.1 binding-protein-dependent transport systems inner membrane component [Tsukamurella paurometabola DSM 20162]SUP36300.1 Putative aliphatic sulfonates transport permease protein ssuC [Tsukamurella paurometabola]